MRSFSMPMTRTPLPPAQRQPEAEDAQAMLYALQSAARPRVTETLEIAERVRTKLMAAMPEAPVVRTCPDTRSYDQGCFRLYCP